MSKRILLLAAIVASQALSAAPLTGLKPLYPRTPLVVEGQAQAVIVAPASVTAAARRLSSRLHEGSGDRLETLSPERLVSESWQVDFGVAGGRTLIALGNINDNRLLAVLWGAGYVVADSLYPGPGGYAVRTVHDPFGKGLNVLALTGSDPAGVARAVDLLCDRWLSAAAADVVLAEPVVAAELRIPALRFFPAAADSLASKRQPQYSGLDFFERLFQGNGLMDDKGRVTSAPAGDLTAVTGAVARLAQTWFLTGNPALPPLMKEILDRNRGLLAIVPRRLEMEASSAAHVRWWDLVEELPVWSDQDRLAITNALLADARQGYEPRAANAMVNDGFVQVVDENHGTNSAQNALAAWGYFAKYYRLPESDYWMKVVRATFAGQSASHQVLEDACGYLCYCPIDAMEYAFATGDLTYLSRGIARGHAEFIAQCCVNNLGLATGFGDDGSLVEPAVFEVLTPAAWYHRDPYLAWIAREFLPQAAGLRTFQNALPVDLTVKALEPTQWAGLRVFPIFRQTLRKGEGAKELVFDPPETAGAEWFNKVVFRDRFSPQAQYLLLDGAGKFGTLEGYPSGPAGHMHADVNTLINFTDQERMWLVDHTYADRSIKDHSGLYITRDGQVTYRVHEARLRLAAQSGRSAVTTTVFEGFSGATWERSLFWQRGRRFLIIDRVVAQEPGDYRVRCSFRALGEAGLAGSALRLTQGEKACAIISDGRARLDLEDYALPGGQDFATAYAYAAPVVRIFRQDKTAHLESGESMGFVNLLQAGPTAGSLLGTTLQPLSGAAALVEDPEGRVVCGVGSLPGDTGDAGAFIVSGTEALLGNLRRLGDRAAPVLVAAAPVTLSWRHGGEVRVETAIPTQLTVGGAAVPLRLDAGNHILPAAVALPVAAALARVLSEAPALAAACARETPPPLPRAGFGLHSTALELRAPVSCATTGDLTGDGRDEVLSGGAEGLRATAADGATLWTLPTAAACQAIACADIDGDGRPEVVAGCANGMVHRVGTDGKAGWEFSCKPGKAGAPTVDWLQIADLDGDGTREIVVGANWVHCLDATGKVRWERYLCRWRGALAGDFAQGALADVNADGKLEIVALFSFSYPKAVVFGHDGQVLLPVDHDDAKNPGVNIESPQALLVTGLCGQKDSLNWLVGSPSYLYTYWAAGPFAGQSGGRVAGAFVHLASWTPAGQLPVVCGATDLGTLIAYRAGARPAGAGVPLGPIWSRESEETVSTLWAGDSDADGKGEVWVGAKNGTVLVYDALTGEPLGSRPASGASVCAVLPQPGRLLVVHRDGGAEYLSLSR